MGHVEDIGEPRIARADGRHARHGQDGDPRCEQNEQHHAGPERGGGKADQGHDGHQMAGPAVRTPPGLHAEADADKDRRAHGGDHEQQRRGQAILNEFHHRKIEEIGVAEIAVQHLAEIGDELVEQALVQPVLLTDGGKQFGAGTAHFASNGHRRIAGSQPDEEEVQAQYQNEQDGRPEQSFSYDTQERHKNSPRMLRMGRGPIPRIDRQARPEQPLSGRTPGRAKFPRPARSSAATSSGKRPYTERGSPRWTRARCRHACCRWCGRRWWP